MLTRSSLLATATAIASAACILGPAAGKAAASTHLGGTFTYPDTLCGFTGTTQFSVEDNFGSLSNGGTYDDGRLRQTFIATNGRGVEIDYSAGHAVFTSPTANGDGTFTQVVTASGLDARTKAVNGTVLEHGAGRVQVTLVEDAQGNALSVSAVALSGDQPNLTGAPDCNVIAPYLGGVR
jgi:hypothetical protein